MRRSEQPLDRTSQNVGASSRNADTGIGALMAMDRGSRYLESAEFLAGILPLNFRVRMITVVSYQPQADSPWSRMADAEEAAAQIAATQSEAFSGARRILEEPSARRMRSDQVSETTLRSRLLA